MPYQLELNEVTPHTTYSDYRVKTLLYNNLTKTSMLKQYSIVTKGLSRLAVRPIVQQNDSGIQVDLERALHSSDTRSFYYDVGVITSKYYKSITRLRADVKTDVESKGTVVVGQY
jgi:hypothetical protein